MRRFALVALALVVGLLIGAVLAGTIGVDRLLRRGPDPETIATATLQSVREQSRLTVFAARFVAVVTSSQSRFGLTARKTLIMPGTVRYDVDLARIGQRDLAWDPATRQLRVTLPPVVITQPQINLTELREYGGDGVLTALTGAEAQLDSANRARGQQELVRQARDALPLRLARDSARRAVERSFAMPLRAAGIDAQVIARFGDEAGDDPSFLDRSRRIEDVLASPAR
ncbi:MAG TPA: DUF4230 domain-containing protein [Allosphingosinicella sp.]|jgi:hypothetical protein